MDFQYERSEMRENRLTEPRIKPVNEDDLSEDLQGIMEGAKKLFGGRVPNVNMTFANHEKLFKRWLVFSNHILSKSTLPPRDREILILRIGWLCRSEYEWGQHMIIGKKAGLTHEEIIRITRGPDAVGWTGIEPLLLKAVDELHGDSMIKSDTWDSLSEHYHQQQMMDLVFTVGQYNLVSMALNSFGVQLEEGVEGFPG